MCPNTALLSINGYKTVTEYDDLALKIYGTSMTNSAVMPLSL
jgi:hypothetical protein